MQILFYKQVWQFVLAHARQAVNCYTYILIEVQVLQVFNLKEDMGPFVIAKPEEWNFKEKFCGKLWITFIVGLMKQQLHIKVANNVSEYIK